MKNMSGPSGWVVLLGVAAVLGAAWLGYRAYMGEHRAGIENISVYLDISGNDMYAGAAIDLTLRFAELPKGDPADVRLRFKSEALSEPLKLSWEDIMSHLRNRSVVTGKPSQPPLGVPIEVRIPIATFVKDRVTFQHLSTLVAKLSPHAFLDWGGKQQDRAGVSLAPLFGP